MTTITWKGEDSSHPGGNGPRFNEWNGVRFEIGKPVDIDDVPGLTPDVRAHMLAKARRNAFYTVEGEEPAEPPKRGPGRPPKVEE